MPDVETLQGLVPYRPEPAPVGMGMYRVSDADLAKSLAARPGTCPACDVELRKGLCVNCSYTRPSSAAPEVPVETHASGDREAPGAKPASSAPLTKALALVADCADYVLGKSMAAPAFPGRSGGGGEGSHGGHVIGHTKSGKPVYGPSHPVYQGAGTHILKPEGKGGALQQVQQHYPHFSLQDHLDAADLHSQHQRATPKQGHLEASLLHGVAAEHQYNSDQPVTGEARTRESNAVYTHLHTHGPASARTISRHTNIPSHRVEAHLDDLLHSGHVEQDASGAGAVYRTKVKKSMDPRIAKALALQVACAEFVASREAAAEEPERQGREEPEPESPAE